MQKIFKIERIESFSEFKRSKPINKDKKKRSRNARKSKQNIDIDKMIAAQAKLLNEEKELLRQRQASTETNELDAPKYEESEDLKLLKSESVISAEHETKDTNNGVDSDNYHNNHSKVYVTSIDAAILEGLDFIENAPMIKEAQMNFHLQKPTLLPEKCGISSEYTLVLDLDETLVHCSISPFEGYDEIKDCIYISYRPYLVEFLEKVSSLFEIVVFTASEREYASMVLDRIDPEQKYIHHRLYRDSWLPHNGNYIKDLSLLGRDINKTIIIDNSVIAFSLNIDNGIPIHSFSGNKQDEELSKLVQIMDYAFSIITDASQFNLKEYLTSIFGLRERIAFWQSQYIAHAQQSVKVSTS